MAAALAAHNQKGLPAIGIYGEDVQDAGSTEIQLIFQEKLASLCAKAGLAVAIIERKSIWLFGFGFIGIAGITYQP